MPENCVIHISNAIYGHHGDGKDIKGHNKWSTEIRKDINNENRK